MQNRDGKKRMGGFTLIELLIVVAIIAILAAIAVPNFMEAQVRTKVARAKADMRTMATAIEAYAVDHNRIPISASEMKWEKNNGPATPGGPHTIAPVGALCVLTTPVAYINSVLKDPFLQNVGATEENNPNAYNRRTFVYLSNYINPVCRKDKVAYKQAFAAGYRWSANSFGPARNSAGNGLIRNILIGIPDSNPNTTDVVCDTTNGTRSAGLIIRTNKGDFTGPQG